MKYKYIIFDLDGTLLDTSEGLIKSINYTLDVMGYPKISDEEKYSFIGPPIKVSLKNKFNLSEEDADFSTNVFRDRYKNYDLYEAKLYDGIIELLELLKFNNIKMSVATYKREDYAISLLEYFKLKKYFEIIRGSDYLSKMTKTDIMDACLIYKNNISKNQILMIGDSESDYISSKKLFIDFLGVTYGFGFKRENINKYKDIILVNSVYEIKKFLNNKKEDKIKCL
ncbi:hypothetical protein EPJ65_04055 [Brachyspira aalborgi]|uniref:HAD-IA family hydrolase n=1 Tax=Brachyspira aalborgi TaxID=29522 RepID=UPI0011C80622|nr:HAD-IA family hydrolase [Brachyspira aalborgi]TXJ43418.1 hypothetical protein EPJ65_04055 [Brachyspira aalborgi]